MTVRTQHAHCVAAQPLSPLSVQQSCSSAWDKQSPNIAEPQNRTATMMVTKRLKRRFTGENMVKVTNDVNSLLARSTESCKKIAMSTWIKVAEVSDLNPGEGKTVMAGDRELALFNVAGKFHCIDNICPHRGGPMSEGVLEGQVAVCPWHGWRFDVVTGLSPVVKTAKVDTFEVVVEGNDVKVKID
jgi:nitrite reductase/ring-hydroxylating ferredoxin subunit